MIGETPPDGDGGVSPAIVPPVLITTTHSQVSYVSNLTGNAHVSPESEFPASLVLKSSHLRIPLTPPSRMMICLMRSCLKNDTTVIFKEGLSMRQV